MEKTSTFSGGQYRIQETQNPRFATEDDVPYILTLALDFISTTPYAEVGAVEEDVLDMIYQCLDHGCIVFNGTGFLAATKVPLFINKNINIAQEFAWWAPQGGGKGLREMLEQWASDTGTKIVRMTSIIGEDGGRVVQNLAANGYTPIEIAHVKVL